MESLLCLFLITVFLHFYARAIPTPKSSIPIQVAAQSVIYEMKGGFECRNVIVLGNSPGNIFKKKQ